MSGKEQKKNESLLHMEIVLFNTTASIDVQNSYDVIVLIEKREKKGSNEELSESQFLFSWIR